VTELEARIRVVEVALYVMSRSRENLVRILRKQKDNVPENRQEDPHRGYLDFLDLHSPRPPRLLVSQKQKNKEKRDQELPEPPEEKNTGRIGTSSGHTKPKTISLEKLLVNHESALRTVKDEKNVAEEKIGRYRSVDAIFGFHTASENFSEALNLYEKAQKRIENVYASWSDFAANTENEKNTREFSMEALKKSHETIGDTIQSLNQENVRRLVENKKLYDVIRLSDFNALRAAGQMTRITAQVIDGKNRGWEEKFRARYVVAIRGYLKPYRNEFTKTVLDAGYFCVHVHSKSGTLEHESDVTYMHVKPHNMEYVRLDKFNPSIVLQFNAMKALYDGAEKVESSGHVV
jgi:hypothetical protein